MFLWAGSFRSLNCKHFIYIFRIFVLFPAFVSIVYILLTFSIKIAIVNVLFYTTQKSVFFLVIKCLMDLISAVILTDLRNYEHPNRGKSGTAMPPLPRFMCHCCPITDTFAPVGCQSCPHVCYT